MPSSRPCRVALIPTLRLGLAVALLTVLPAGAAQPARRGAPARGAATPAVTASAPAPISAELAAAQKLFLQGEYEAALAAAEQGTTADVFNEAWWRLRADTLITLGRYAEARDQLTRALRYNTQSVRLRLLAREAALFTQHEDEARTRLVEIRSLIDSRGRTDRSAEFLTAVGEAAIILGAEPKLVLENFLRPGQRVSLR
ncbi:MAG: hypothetical protein WCL04_05150, partial [Verrucomicrobiota bacterium]